MMIRATFPHRCADAADTYIVFVANTYGVSSGWTAHRTGETKLCPPARCQRGPQCCDAARLGPAQLGGSPHAPPTASRRPPCSGSSSCRRVLLALPGTMLGYPRFANILMQAARNTGSGDSYKSRQSSGRGGKDDKDGKDEQEDTSKDNSTGGKDSLDCSQEFGTSDDRSSKENTNDIHLEAAIASDSECEKVAIRPEESLVDWIDRQLREAEERRRDTQLSNVK